MRLLLGAFLALTAAMAPVAAQKRIAFSFDDIPRHQGAFMTPDERGKRLIAALKRAKVKQAVFFLNPGKLAERQGQGGEGRIAAYVRAGHVIANHSNTHPMLTAVSAAHYLADIDAAESWLKGKAGYRPWFRFPFLNEGRDDKAKRDAVRAGLAARGLRNGYVTVDAADWHIDNLTIAAKKAGKMIDMAALRDFYVARHVEAANFNEQLAVEATGRAPAHVVLLHETDIAALFIGDLVAALRKDGWTIVSADEAYRDPIGALRPDVPSAQGTMTEALAWEKGMPAPRWYPLLNTEALSARFDAEVLKKGMSR